ncbi:hypothetical protein B296_00021994 [Ensete ventricosum]|uniref:Uncharacterized protein n=1 Tax=Ensete ventricosum TaxID=4639 RepID=A0A426YIT0_ENSVE|nr:hypothetical protein B296_00021994 [Ensete ventricosum]
MHIHLKYRILSTSFLGRALLYQPKVPAFDYLDEKPIDTGIMKFLGLCPSTLSWYLEFAFTFSTSRPLLRLMLSLHESKGSMTLGKSRLYNTMAYYTLPCICIPSFVISRSASTAQWCSSESTSFLTDALLLGS